MSDDSASSDAFASKVVKVEVVMEGYLEKKSPKSVMGVQKWQRRYFVLTLSTTDRGLNYKVLSYFRSAEEEEPLGNIPLINIKGVNVSSTDPLRFDLVMTGRTYRLRSIAADETKKWVSSMSNTIERPTYNHPAHLPKTAVETMKLMSEFPPDQKKLAEAEKTIEMMKHGERFVKYDYDFTNQNNECKQYPIMLFYTSSSDSDLGSLHWCGVEELVVYQDKTLSLSRLSDIYVGKHSKAFKHPIANHITTEKCFTAAFSHPKDGPPHPKGLNASGLIECNLEGQTKEQLAAWLFGINSIMMSKGKRKVVSGKRKTEEKSAATATATTPKTATPTAKPVAAASPTNKSSSSASSTTAVPTHSSSSSISSSASPSLSSTSDSDSKSETPADSLSPDDQESQEQLEQLNAVSPQKLIIQQVNLDDDEKTPSAVPSSPSNSASQDVKSKEVLQWLSDLGTAFEAYFVPFKENGVDMAFLLTCNDDDLEELGVSRLHRKRILHAIDELREAKGLHKRGDIPIVSADSAPTPPPFYGAPAPPPGAPSMAPTAPAPSSSTKRDPLAALKEQKRNSIAKGTGGPKRPDAAASTVSMTDIIKGIREAKLKKVDRDDDKGKNAAALAPPEFAKVSLRKSSDNPSDSNKKDKDAQSSSQMPAVSLKRAGDRPDRKSMDANTPMAVNPLDEARKKMAEKKALKEKSGGGTESPKITPAPTPTPTSAASSSSSASRPLASSSPPSSSVSAPPVDTAEADAMAREAEEESLAADADAGQ